MDILSQFPGKYLKAADFPAPRSLTINRVHNEMVGQEKDSKPVIYFDGEDRGIVLNKTNANTLAQLHGRDTTKWSGKSVECYATKVQFGMEMVDSIRMQEPTVPFEDADVGF